MLRKRLFLFLYICVFIYTAFCSVSFAEDNIESIISDAAAFITAQGKNIPEPYCIVYSTPDTSIKYSVCFSDMPFYFDKNNRLTSDGNAPRADFSTSKNCFSAVGTGVTSYLTVSKINLMYVNHNVMNYDGTELILQMSEPIQTPTPIPTKTPVPTNTPAPTKTPVPTNSPAADEEDNGGFWSSILSKITDLFDIVKQTFKDMRTKEFWSDFFDGIKFAFKQTEDSIISLKDSVIEFFKSFWNKLQDIFSWVDRTFGISEHLSSLKSIFSSGIDRIWNWCSDFGEKTKTFFQELPEKLKNWFVNLIDTLINLKDKVSSFFSSFWDKLKESFMSFIDKIKGFFVGIKDVVVGGFNRVTGFFKNIWTSFANLFVLPDNYFEDKFEEIFSAVSEKLGL